MDATKILLQVVHFQRRWSAKTRARQLRAQTTQKSLLFLRLGRTLQNIKCFVSQQAGCDVVTVQLKFDSLDSTAGGRDVATLASPTTRYIVTPAGPIKQERVVRYRIKTAGNSAFGALRYASRDVGFVHPTGTAKPPALKRQVKPAANTPKRICFETDEVCYRRGVLARYGSSTAVHYTC